MGTVQVLFSIKSVLRVVESETHLIYENEERVFLSQLYPQMLSIINNTKKSIFPILWICLQLLEEPLSMYLYCTLSDLSDYICH